MKSMKQIADELNVTKMTVYNNAKKANEIGRASCRERV